MRTISLRNDFTALSRVSPTPSLARRIDLPPSDYAPKLCSVTSMSVAGNVLVASVAILPPSEESISRILVARVDSGPAYWMQREPYQVFVTQ